MTFTELKTLIQNYIENDETNFVNTLNDMIINTEERIAELIEFDYFRKNVTGSLTAGNTYLTAPTDFKLSFSFKTSFIDDLRVLLGDWLQYFFKTFRTLVLLLVANNN